MAEMSTFLAVASALSVVNLLFLLILGSIWGRNYREFRSPMTLGLLSFAALLFIENIVALSFFFSMGMLYAGSSTAQLTVLTMRALQVLALAFLTLVSLR